MSEILRIDREYATWVQDISKRFKRSQIKAATAVKSEMLLFYWELGADIIEKKMLSGYCTNFYNNLSIDLKEMIPDAKSFSPRNLRYMAEFYELYNMNGDVCHPNIKYTSGNLQQLVANSEDNYIFRIPWGHHIQILTKCKGDKEKALFFVKKVCKNNWSRAVLINFLDTNLYEREGKAITNFNKILPDIGSDLADEITKDPYNFDFLTLRSDYDERELKDALMNNIQSLQLELGKGFAFVGREYRLVVGQTEQFIDMLFYNMQQHSNGDNPTIGLLICKTKDNVLAQYATSAINVPIGISEYEFNNIIPEGYKSSMPTIEEIERELKD